jgi:hypothetical protein
MLRGLAALALVLVAVPALFVAGSVTPAVASGTITITDNSTPGPPYVDGDSLTVSGTAASTSQKTVTILECVGDPSMYPSGTMLSQSTIASSCDGRNGVTVSTNNGAFSTLMTFVGWLLPSGGGTGYDCSSTSANPTSNGCTIVADPSSAGGGGMIDAATAAKGTNNSCNGVFSGSDFTTNGGFNKSVSINGQPASNGTPVQPSTTITVTLTWNPANFTGQQDMISDCVGTTTDGGSFTIDQTQSQASLQKPVPTGESSYTSSYVVPTSASGLQICDRGRVSGVGANGLDGAEKSNRFCFPVGPGTAVPETSHPVLLIIGAVLAGGLVLFALDRIRRRKARRESDGAPV